MKIGFILCSRTNSERLPNKVFRKINGISLIEHLINRLKKTNFEIILAVPSNERKHYEYLKEKKCVSIYSNDTDGECPLNRMARAASMCELDHIIRVTHDKILVDSDDVLKLVNTHIKNEFDYTYSSSFIPGTAIEVISNKSLQEAANKFKNVEFIGYAIRAITENHFDVFMDKKTNYRFLIDYPEDLKLMELIFSTLGNDVTKQDAIEYLNLNPEFLIINEHPETSVYTCAYNAKSWIRQCMESVTKQNDFKKMEYIIVDDFSNDGTFEEIIKYSLKFNNIKVIRNDSNLGLASSCNIALKHAKGKYIIRLDADDYFTRLEAIRLLKNKMIQSGSDIVYPDNYHGIYLRNVQKGNENHHAGGALFNRSALNHIKFTDGLRGHDSLDLFLRAKNSLKIDYLNIPVFFYRQHEKSLTKNNLKEREEIKNKLLKESAIHG